MNEDNELIEVSELQRTLSPYSRVNAAANIMLITFLYLIMNTHLVRGMWTGKVIGIEIFDNEMSPVYASLILRPDDHPQIDGVISPEIGVNLPFGTCQRHNIMHSANLWHITGKPIYDWKPGVSSWYRSPESFSSESARPDLARCAWTGTPNDIIINFP